MEGLLYKVVLFLSKNFKLIFLAVIGKLSPDKYYIFLLYNSVVFFQKMD